MAKIVPLLLANRFLHQDEVEEICQYCQKFGERFKILFPNETITRKLHELIFYVPVFVKEFHSVGIFSENECEALHKAIARILISLSGFRDHGEKLRLCLERHSLRSIAEKNLMKKVPRICLSCIENFEQRYFYKKDPIDGLKKCLKCGQLAHS